MLTSDDIEAVRKIFSMMKTLIKNDKYFSERCFGYWTLWSTIYKDAQIYVQ